MFCLLEVTLHIAAPHALGLATDPAQHAVHVRQEAALDVSVLAVGRICRTGRLSSMKFSLNLGRLFTVLARNILSVCDTNSNDLFLGIIENLKILNVLAEFSSTGHSQSTQHVCFENVLWTKIQPIHFQSTQHVCFENVLWTKIQPIHFQNTQHVCFENVLWTKIQPIHFIFLSFQLFRGRVH